MALNEFRDNQRQEVKDITQITFRNRIGTNRPRSSGIYSGQSQNNNNDAFNGDHLYKFDDHRSHSLPPLNRGNISNKNEIISKQKKITKITL